MLNCCAPFLGRTEIEVKKGAKTASNINYTQRIFKEVEEVEVEKKSMSPLDIIKIWNSLYDEITLFF